MSQIFVDTKYEHIGLRRPESSYAIFNTLDINYMLIIKIACMRLLELFQWHILLQTCQKLI